MISASLSLSLPRLGWKSTSTPRSLKICTAAGDSASEMRTLGDMASRRLRQSVLALGESPVEPQRQRLDVGALGGRAAPDAQARWSIAIRVDVIGHALLVERGGDALDERRLRLGRQPGH